MSSDILSAGMTPAQSHEAPADVPPPPPFEAEVPLDPPEAPAVAEKAPAVVKVSQASLLVDLALTIATFFRTPDLTPYADVEVDGHRETWPIRGRDLRLRLVGAFFREHKRAPSRDALSEALSTLEAIARFEGKEQQVFLRVASTENAIYVDLCNREWEVVEITAAGYGVINNPPVRFRRASGMLALPKPQRGGDIGLLRPFVNAGSTNNFRLIVGWAAGAICPDGPYFIMPLQAEQGGGKSTTAKVLRALVDPSTAPLRRPPRDERDAMIASQNNWMLSFDNLSGLPIWLADVLCCMSTGGGFSTRRLTTDQDEVIFSAKRPVLINGIDELGERNDVNDRSLKLNLPTISAANRRDEKSFWAAFELARPLILGALYEAISTALRNLSTTTLPELPRMADAVLWITAAESAFGWPPGSFLEAYNENRREAIDVTLGGDLLPATIRKFVASLKPAPSWEGSADTLLSQLRKAAPDGAIYAPSWPKAANALSSKLRRIAPGLRAEGIDVVFDLRDAETGGRKLRVSWTPVTSAPGVAAAPADAGDVAPDDGAYGDGAEGDDFDHGADRDDDDADDPDDPLAADPAVTTRPSTRWLGTPVTKASADGLYDLNDPPQTQPGGGEPPTSGGAS